MARQWQVLIVTSIAVFMAFLDATIVNIAFPDIRASFPDASVAGLSWVLNAYNIVFAALLVPAGRLADVIGRKRMFIGGGAVFVGASVLCGLAPSAQALIGLRVLQAVGGAALVPTSLGLLLPEFPLRLRATATALWGATGAVAAATGPSLGGVLVDAASWRWVFFVNLPVGLAALVPARRLLREHREPGGALPDGLGAALLALGVGAVSLGIVEGPGWHWDGRVAGAVVTGLVLLAAFAVRSARHPSPALELSLFRVRSFAVANVGVLVFSLGFYALLLGNVLFLTGVWHYSVLEAGFALTPGPLMAALAAPFGGRLSDRFGQRVVAVPGGLLFAAGAALFALDIGATPNYVTEFLPATMLTGTGVGLSFSAFGSAAVAELPPRRYATGSAVSACSRQIGAVLGISVLIAVVGSPAPDEALGAFRDAWALMALTGASAGLIALGLGRIRARDPDAAPASPVAATPVA
jgi:EmrB/QacA subfamily drug resistance transporter